MQEEWEEGDSGILKTWRDVADAVVDDEVEALYLKTVSSHYAVLDLSSSVDSQLLAYSAGGVDGDEAKKSSNWSPDTVARKDSFFDGIGRTSRSSSLPQPIPMMQTNISTCVLAYSYTDTVEDHLADVLVSSLDRKTKDMAAKLHSFHPRGLPHEDSEEVIYRALEHAGSRAVSLSEAPSNTPEPSSDHEFVDEVAAFSGIEI